MNQEFTSTDLSGFAKATTENFSKIQKELGEVFEEANRHWAARAKSEADSASELIAKLSNARSLPDATAAYQEWMTQRVQRLGEDGQRLIADNQKLVSTWTKLLSNGAAGGNT
jgi:hypothetical protein